MIFMHFRRALGVFFAVAAFSPIVLACPGNRGEALPAAPEARLALEQELDAAPIRCQKSPGFLALRAALLLSKGLPAEAAALLEQALLLDPNHAGAKIDYAEALAALGDQTAALALIDDVLARPDLPPALESMLRTRRVAYETESPSAWIGRGSLAMKYGRDSNLNSAPAAGNFNLTFPDGLATLQLADHYRARGGAAGMMEASGQATRGLGSGSQLAVFGEARARQSHVASDTDYRQLDLATSWTTLHADGENSAVLGASFLDYGGTTLYRAVRVQATHDWAGAACRPRAGVELEARRYPASPELDGLFIGVSGSLVCLAGDFPLVASVRFGRDKPSAARPGEQQQRVDMRLYAVRPLGAGRVVADGTLGLQRDAAGYSPLLENGARRGLARASLRLEYAHPITPGWEMVGSLEFMKQRSNLQLFEVAGQSAYLGVRRLW